MRIIFVMVLVALSAVRCNVDRLDVEPVNEFLSENFYITEEQVFSGLIAAYDPLGWSMAFGQWVSHVMYGDIRSDNAYAGGDPSDNDQPGWQELDDFRNTNTNTVIHPIYRKYYIGIFRANLVLSKPQISTPAVERYQAEAKFLRAFYHFELFWNFVPIPVIT
ncbi:MAG: RagB/SusD family nutrient uptake outer membrane protein [Saprospiraceae bacterium]|nr:RagB/SusD family nutrient uptake outer membrane protein [Saprospiraceae bacterium]